MMTRFARHLLLLARCCALAAIATACATTPAESESSHHSDVCIAAGDGGCAIDRDCCGEAICSATGTCRLPDGAACRSIESGCLAGRFCVDGACSPTCGEAGQTVTDGVGCCEGAPDESGVCPDTCIAVLDYGCAADADCCGDGVCMPNGVCRLPDGAACTSIESGCLAGRFCVDGACSPTCGEAGQTVTDGVGCCEGAPDESGVCPDTCIAVPDYGCAADADCCGDGVCMPNGVCRLPDGATCTSSESCIGGHHCVDGACSASCGLVGQAAEDAADCCSGMLGLDGRCMERRGLCKPVSHACSANSECCSGSCFLGACRAVVSM